MPPQLATSKQGSEAIALRPVSARTYMRTYEEPAPAGKSAHRCKPCTSVHMLRPCAADHSGSAGPMPLQSFKSYKNDLFGEEDGDVLAAETIPVAKPIEITIARPTTPSNRVQQQIAINQQKRLARLQVLFHMQKSLRSGVIPIRCTQTDMLPLTVQPRTCQAACQP